MAGKYARLTSWLTAQPPRSFEATFREIESVLGFQLPPSSRAHVAHWHGSQGSAVARAIRAAGWKARMVDLRAGRLTFEPGVAPTAPRALPIGGAVPLLGEEGRYTPASPMPDDGVAEDAVVDGVVRHLSRQGWAIANVAKAARRERGDDIRAERDGMTLVVEAKGYPSRKYADPRRAGELKPTHPTLQAKHWLSNALLTALHVLGTRPGVAVAIALPGSTRYSNLIDEIEGPLRTLNVGVFFVQADGSVEERIPIGAASSS